MTDNYCVAAAAAAAEQDGFGSRAPPQSADLNTHGRARPQADGGRPKHPHDGRSAQRQTQHTSVVLMLSSYLQCINLFTDFSHKTYHPHSFYVTVFFFLALMGAMPQLCTKCCVRTIYNFQNYFYRGFRLRNVSILHCKKEISNKLTHTNKLD